MPRKDNAKTQKQKTAEKKAAEQSKANKYNDRNKTKTNIYSTGGNKTTGGTTTKPTTKPTGTTTKPTTKPTTGTTTKPTGGTTTKPTTTKPTGGVSLPSVSKDNKAAWDDFAKGNGPATAPGLPATGTGASKPSTPSTPSAPSTSGGSGNASPGKPGQTTPGASSSGYDNGGLTAEQIKAMQRFYGTNADGMWGANSTAAAGGMTAADAWNAYQTALREQLEQEQLEQEQQQQQQQGQQPGTGTQGTGTPLPGVPAGSTGKVTADFSGMRDLLDQWLSAAKQQQEAAINYGVEQGVNELRRAEEDAQQQYQAQQDQINIDEARAKDNQALYAEARGDRGGIGAAQYDSIMNAAAQNRLTVSQQQTKLSTDTARQIADLRAQGEYKKADAVLELTQRYLTQLMSLEQWALNYQMDVAQFNLQLEKWQAEYALSLAKLKGTSTGGTISGSSGGSRGSGGTSSRGSGGTSSGGSGVNPSAMTSAEVKEWQRKLGVTADGIWGPNTQAAYDKLMNPNKNQDPHIVNPSSTSSGWVAIPGHGRFSYQELKVLVDKGKVKETKKSDGTYAYTWVNK